MQKSDINWQAERITKHRIFPLRINRNMQGLKKETVSFGLDLKHDLMLSSTKLRESGIKLYDLKTHFGLTAILRTADNLYTAERLRYKTGSVTILLQL